MSALYVGTLPDGTDIKLDIWDDGTLEVAVRDMTSRRWGIPVTLQQEVVEPLTSNDWQGLAEFADWVDGGGAQ